MTKLSLTVAVPKPWNVQASHSTGDLQKILDAVDNKIGPELLMDLVEQFERYQVVREGVPGQACLAAAQRGNLRARIWLCQRGWAAACGAYRQWEQPSLADPRTA